MYKETPYLKDYRIKVYKREAICAAKDLQYSHAVIDSLKKAKSIGQIERIMIDSRCAV